MDEKQLQFLFDNYAKNKGFKDINEFRDLMNDGNSRKVFFEDSNKELGFKDMNDFEETIGVKKKGTSVTPSPSLVTPSQLPVQETKPEIVEKDPITASLEAEQKRNAVKEIIPTSVEANPLLGAVDTQFGAYPELNKQGEDESKLLQQKGVDSKHVASLFSDLPKEILADPNHLAKYNQMLRDTPTALEIQLSHDKWKPEIMAIRS